MAGVRRAIAQAEQRARRALLEIGREIHDARVARGLSQAAVANAAGLTQSQVSRIERGLCVTVRIDALGRLAAAVGLDLSMKLYPGGQPLRDHAHIALLERFQQAVGHAWTWSSEVPLPIPADRRAWDRVMRGAAITIGVEGETRPTDMQDLGRRLALKKRDGGVDRLILVLANTDWCRRLIRLNDLDTAFPIQGKTALKALAEGRDPGGDAIILI
jgi:transcriptional regulator with XRE-family HTH domain